MRDFAAWLIGQGWTVRTEIDYVDVVAERDGQRLVAEAKGHTTSPGLDIDTAWGQLLRRMPVIDDGTTRYALVVRDESRSVRAATRVPSRICELLRVTLYAVATNGTIREVNS
ncbi:hypothetical protein [Actinophytocola sp.]|uniref:hypothetical protein n=1 Tax=Actinophytocola sp. TaxID=1872138 RepID=UPI00389A19EC